VVVAVVRDRVTRQLTITLGAVGERPEQFSAASAQELPGTVELDAIDVIEDLNGSDHYKRHLAGVFIRRAVALLEEDRSA
jgi:carbon-monoxide dehydrogenase medium subunit